MVINLKKVIVLLLIIFVGKIIYSYRNDIKTYVENYSKDTKKEIVVPKDNEYKRYNTTYKYVSNTENFVPNSKQDLMNIIYTTLNSGWDEFTFYCPSEYKSCVDDVVEITNDDILLSNINGFVHPYNSFKSIETAYTTQGKITLDVHKIYNEDMIDKINKVVDEVISEELDSSMSEEEKIKAIHDYIINNSKYDSERISGITKYNSNTAYGNLIEGYGICSGYTDAMAIFLDRLKIKNYKISSNEHIWNLVYINNKWLNLDLTFDDPVTSDNEDILQHDYFLIDTDKLLELDKDEHEFDKNVFIEANS